MLGWRLVPGELLRFSLESGYAPADAELERVEHWEYLVRDVDDRGVASLEGRLSGMGLRVERPEAPLSDALLTEATELEKARAGARPIRLNIAMDGRLVSIDGPDWADALPHRLIALQLSDDPVLPGDRWPDPAVARPYADLVPVELEVRVEGYQAFEGLFSREGQAQALIRTEGAVEVEDGPALRIAGESWWEPQSGRLRERTLVVTPDDGQTPPLRLRLSALDG